VLYNRSTAPGAGDDPRVTRARELLRSTYGVGAQTVARAPGRLELFGAHTDYNEGYVASIAIRQAAVAAVSSRADGMVRAVSDQESGPANFSVDELDAGADGQWWDYLAGVIKLLREHGCQIGGADVALVSDVPVGSGVSSSAAVELAYALALAAAAEFEIGAEELALLCQRAENEYVGMRCGILDQFSSTFGQAGRAMWLDCRTLERRAVPITDDRAQFVVCDTRKPRELVGSAYNERRGQCEEAARLLGVGALRDLDTATLERRASELNGTLLRRARHVVSENERVHEGVSLLEAGEMAGVGDVINRTHESLRDDYGVSCPELEAMRAAALDAPGCYGARLVGAGFGGCVMALVDASGVEEFIAQVGARYEAATGLVPRIFATQACDGAGVL